MLDMPLQLCSMIEIEVEMDSDVIVAEAASSAERISEQIQQLMEIDSLEEASISYVHQLTFNRKCFVRTNSCF
jgi:nitrate reductase NapAB chaperone NapD